MLEEREREKEKEKELWKWKMRENIQRKKYNEFIVLFDHRANSMGEGISDDQRFKRA